MDNETPQTSAPIPWKTQVYIHMGSSQVFTEGLFYFLGSLSFAIEHSCFPDTQLAFLCRELCGNFPVWFSITLLGKWCQQRISFPS